MKKRIYKTKVLTGIIFCLCLGTLFLSSSLFVNAQITPKWYFAVFMGMILALTAMAFLFFGQTQKSQYRFLLSYIYFIITTLCTVQAVYGILQYFGVMPAVNGFRVTGSFDNPAGFAASLRAGAPAVFCILIMKNNMKKITVLILASFLSFGVFYSCTEQSKNTANIDDMKQAHLFKLSDILMTPDSLRTAEDKALFQKMEAFVYEGIAVKDERFEITFGKEELKKRGILEVYYDAVKKDVAEINNYLDTTSVFWRNSMIDAFMKSREEYLTKSLAK